MKDKWFVGDTLLQKDLSSTLELIKRHGRSGFYAGEIADKIVKTSIDLGGLISHQDLKEYNAIW